MKYNTLHQNWLTLKLMISYFFKILAINLSLTYSSIFHHIILLFTSLQRSTPLTKNIPSRARSPARERYVQFSLSIINYQSMSFS